MVLKSIGVKLKGAVGSYRDFDDRPGLTLKIDKYKKSERFHSMEKFLKINAILNWCWNFELDMESPGSIVSL